MSPRRSPPQVPGDSHRTHSRDLRRSGSPAPPPTQPLHPDAAPVTAAVAQPCGSSSEPLQAPDSAFPPAQSLLGSLQSLQDHSKEGTGRECSLCSAPRWPRDPAEARRAGARAPKNRRRSSSAPSSARAGMSSAPTSCSGIWPGRAVLWQRRDWGGRSRCRDPPSPSLCPAQLSGRGHSGASPCRQHLAALSPLPAQNPAGRTSQQLDGRGAGSTPSHIRGDLLGSV